MFAFGAPEVIDVPELTVGFGALIGEYNLQTK